IVFHSLAALAYAALAALLWRPVTQSQSSGMGHAGRLCLLVALLVHGYALRRAILLGPDLHLGWALALSAAVWLGMLVFWLESLAQRLDGLLLILLPASALVTALAALFPIGHTVENAGDDW